jgi:hypothetical protein
LQLLGRYSVLYVLAVASTATFAYFLPHQIEKATLGGTRGGAKLLDKHIPTWTAQDADLLLSGLGAAGRQAYRHFYLTYDFYFPALLSSLALARNNDHAASCNGVNCTVYPRFFSRLTRRTI